MTYNTDNKMDPARIAPVARLPSLKARSVCRKRCTIAPKARQTQQLGVAARTKNRPKYIDCTEVEKEPDLRALKRPIPARVESAGGRGV